MKNLLILLLLSVSLVTLANDTTYVTKDSVLVTKTTSLERYKTIVSSPNFFNRLTIYDRKDRYGYYKEFVFYKNLKK